MKKEYWKTKTFCLRGGGGGLIYLSLSYSCLPEFYVNDLAAYSCKLRYQQ